MNTIEIKKVSNGYIVVPSYRNTGQSTPGEEVSVFETFESLAEYLRKFFGADVAPVSFRQTEW